MNTNCCDACASLCSISTKMYDFHFCIKELKKKTFYTTTGTSGVPIIPNRNSVDCYKMVWRSYHKYLGGKYFALPGIFYLIMILLFLLTGSLTRKIRVK